MYRLVLGLFVYGLLSATEILAQTAEPGAVTAAGSVTLQRQPEVMRMRVDVLARAGTVEEALELLKSQIATARAQAVKLGAEESSIEFASPKITSQMTDEQRQLQQMMAERMARAGRNRNSSEISVPVTVSAAMSAQWKLDTASPEELLATSHALQEKVRAADLAGAEAAQKLSPEQQEILEEMQSEFDGYYGGEDTKPGDPVFAFVAAISDEERDQALAEAFAKAKADAERLARAAGVRLGPIRSLSSHAQTGGDESGYDPYGYGIYQTAYPFLSASADGASGESQPEAVGSEAGPVTYTVTVSASFSLAE